MKPITGVAACLVLPCAPKPLLACGGCTDASILITTPWAGFGALFLWAWIVVILGACWCVRGAGNAGTVVRHSTLIVFGFLGSVGYVVLWFLTMGSLLLPSFLIGFVWAVYVVVRLLIDAARFFRKRTPELCVRLPIHGAFLLAAAAVIAYGRAKVNTLEHQIASLRYSQPQVCSKVMPGIVARGEDAVEPLVQAARDALDNDDDYVRGNILIASTFCLAGIGGRQAEQFLAELLNERVDFADVSDRRWHKAACFSYARCAGPRAADDLVALFQRMPHRENGDDRWVPLVALAITGSREGVLFVLDHMDLLLRGLEWGGDGNERRVLQAAAEALVLGSDVRLLREIPAYRAVFLVGAIWRAEPRPNDYTFEFFWTRSSESRLRPPEEIAATWKKDSAAIRKRWAELLQ